MQSVDMSAIAQRDRALAALINIGATIGANEDNVVGAVKNLASNAAKLEAQLSEVRSILCADSGRTAAENARMRMDELTWTRMERDAERDEREKLAMEADQLRTDLDVARSQVVARGPVKHEHSCTVMFRTHWLEGATFIRPGSTVLAIEHSFELADFAPEPVKRMSLVEQLKGEWTVTVSWDPT